jgi:hypothetical protein
VRDRVLAGGARAMANVRSRTAAPPPPPAALPLPPPRRSLRHRAALSRARRVRNAAHRIRRSGCCWRDQREDLGVGPFVRVRIQEAHPLAWSIACGGLRVGRTRRGQHGPWQRAARRRARSCSSKAPRAAAAVHVVHGTWWRGCWGRASGGPAAEDIGAPPKYKGRLCACTARSCSSAGGEGKRLCRVRDAAAASGGPAAEDIGARPKHKGRLARAIGSVASRAYLLRRQQGGRPTRMVV